MPCGFPILIFEFLNWALFLAIWIVLAEQISCDSSFCSLPGGGHSTIDPCNTIYAALAFAVTGWVMFTVSFYGCRSRRAKPRWRVLMPRIMSDLGECDNGGWKLQSCFMS